MNTIIVSGISRGLGQGIHDLLRNNKTFQKCIYFSRKKSNLRDYGGDYIETDLADLDKEKLNLNINQETKKVVFINNAGTIDPIKKATKLNCSEIEIGFKVNCLAPFIISQSLTIATGKIGAKLLIINISSGAASAPIGGWLSYCMAKAAVAMALDVLARENDHVRVIHFDPGVMNTDMQKIIRNQSIEVMPDVERFRGYSNNQNLRAPIDVAKEILTIASEFIL